MYENYNGWYDYKIYKELRRVKMEIFPIIYYESGMYSVLFKKIGKINVVFSKGWISYSVVSDIIRIMTLEQLDSEDFYEIMAEKIKEIINKYLTDYFHSEWYFIERHQEDIYNLVDEIYDEISTNGVIYLKGTQNRHRNDRIKRLKVGVSNI